MWLVLFFFFSSRRRHTRLQGDWSSDVCSTDARGKLTRYAFNKYGNPLTIAGPAGTTSMTWAVNDVLMLSKTDANGVVTSYTYDANGNQTSEQVSGGGGTQAVST